MMIEIVINGEKRSVPEHSTVRSLLEELGVAHREGTAVAVNMEVVPRTAHLQQCYSRVTVWRSSRPLAVAKRGGRMKYEDPLIIGGKEFQSRLIVGTGKYPTLELMQQCHEASGADMVTVAVRRMEL